VNHGQNMGEDVLYSGTVAAAMEGLTLGIPSIAVSFASTGARLELETLTQQVELLGRVLRHLISLPQFPPDTLLNVNMPGLSPDEVRGVRLTRLGRRVYSNSLTPMSDPWGRQIYWIGGGSAAWSGEDDSDFRAVRDGYVSVTPLRLDLTHFDLLSTAASWWQDL
jgi:5'-nucleotidase